ncbi:hypothetical protein [Nostoc sp.]|uniref:hypothetical protein n=1 Tax=Nostoc sp. TaxID=1180 RepID=UPI0035944F92
MYLIAAGSAVCNFGYDSIFVGVKVSKAQASRIDKPKKSHAFKVWDCQLITL